jgi:aryl-alcohol dehydrogenase-like predicted oxidoreductase
MGEMRTIGELKVSIAGLGCNNFGRRIGAERSAAVVHAALEAGVTLFDTADLYGDGDSERFLGAALGARRDDAVIVTKFGMLPPPDGLSGGHPDWINRACESSLRRLGTDRIDLYLIHRPDPETPVGETLSALNALIDQGKVREIGCSNFSAAQLDEAAEAAATNRLRGFATVQNQYSLLHREPEDGVLEACERLGMSLMPYFPLASGVLTGKYRRGEPAPAGARLSGSDGDVAENVVGEDRLSAVERLSEFAASRGHTLLDLALSWLAARPTVATVIAGATSAGQVRANAAATSSWVLSSDDTTRIDDLLGAGR